MTEADVQARIMLRLGGRRDVRLFRNNTGQAWQGERDKRSTREVLILHRPRPITFGLAVGSPDLVGWQSVTIQPEHVGRTLAVFLAPEVKQHGGKRGDDQRAFLAAMARAGALGGFAESPEEAERFLL